MPRAFLIFAFLLKRKVVLGTKYVKYFNYLSVNFISIILHIKSVFYKFLQHIWTTLFPKTDSHQNQKDQHLLKCEIADTLEQDILNVQSEEI